MATTQVAPLSGGEKARLALALLIWRRPNLLLLDEPTNHLDLEMRHALSEALQEFEGALVVVSHDRHLLRVTSDELLLVDGGALAPFPGDLDDYPAWLAKRQAAADRAAEDAAGGTPQGVASRKDQRRREAEQRRRLQPLRTRLQTLERRIAALAGRREELERALAAPDLYEAAGKPRLLGLIQEKQRVDVDMEEAEGAWFEVGEALERQASALP